MTNDISDSIASLIAKTSSTIPEDIKNAISNAIQLETNNSAKTILQTILNNADMAKSKHIPMCQDTGTLSFLVKMPYGTNSFDIEESIRIGIFKATESGLLRQNTISVPEGKQISTNFAKGNPVIHFIQEDRSNLEIHLLMKGGGSENMSRQYSLPDDKLNAGRDINGVRKCILDAIWNAQGNGCAPGIIGVCIGGDRASSYEYAKEQLRRPLSDESNIPELASLEKQILDEANSLGIGPMGLGGRTTILGIKIGSLARLPASFFVSIAYCCWACRRHSITIDL